MFFNVGLNNFEKHKEMFTKLPEFVACNLKCDLLVLQRLVKCSVNDNEIYVDWCFDGTESAHLEIVFFLLKYNLILTDEGRRMNEENISVW